MTDVAVVTGGSSGIGLCTCLSLCKKGIKVYELSRRESKVEGVTHITADVTDEKAVRDAIEKVIDIEKHIDILVCNAGFGISGAAELTKSEDAHKQMEVNLFGADNAIKAVLPYMREQKKGRIICISSIAGILPIPFQLWYSVSKSAIISYVLALQNEVRPFNIFVTAVLPGDIKTGFTEARQKDDDTLDVYSQRLSRSVASMEHDEQNGMSAEFAGNFVAKYAVKKKSKPIVSMGFSYRLIAVLSKILPRRFSNFVVGKLYAK